MRTVVAVGGATLLVLMLLLGLMMQRRRHYLDRIAFEAKARRELEARVVERTSDLEGLNRRLKQEVLEREHAQQELVRAQDDLVQAGKLSALGTMSASISHELNQPLAAIRSYAENAEILLDHERTADARGNLKLISELTGRMASIIAHLRAFARRDRHAPESVALQPALDDALALLAKRRRSMEVELIRDLPEATLWVQAGETRLRQVLGNLLANALDALTEKGPPRKLWLSAETTAQGVNLYIRDNGPGFCMEALGRASEPFYTTKTRTQGLGLGLAICDTLMRAFGGELLVCQPQGRRRAVNPEIACRLAGRQSATVRGPQCMSIDNQIQVVLIDDDPHLRQALCQTLDLAGLKVLTLGEATGLTARLSRDWPGVVVSDIRMPGMDGLELLAELHGQDPDLPVLLITGHGDVPLAVQAMRAGAYDFLEKPFASDSLLDSVRRALALRRLVLDNRSLRLALSDRQQLSTRLVGHSPQMLRLREQIGALAATKADVLILGETGAGKEVVARALHDLSSRRSGPFVAINAGALAESVVESELFGHEPGAFTGAQKRRIGKFEFANGGTLVPR